MLAKSSSVPAFLCVSEALVDQVLEHLATAGRLPSRCIVISRDMQRLGVLVDQWKDRVDIVTVFVPVPLNDVHDAICMIVENEGCRPEMLRWVSNQTDAVLLPSEWHRVLVSDIGDAKGTADAIGDPD